MNIGPALIIVSMTNVRQAFNNHWGHTPHLYGPNGKASSRVIHSKMLQYYISTPRVPLSKSAGTSIVLPPEGFQTAEQVIPLHQIRRRWRVGGES